MAVYGILPVVVHNRRNKVSEMIKKQQIDKSKPAVLRVTEYILEKSEKNQSFGLYMAESELNDLNRYQIAKIMRDICLDPQGVGSLVKYTTVDSQNLANEPQYWQLNAKTYFSYLSYLAVKEAEKTNKLTANAFRVSVLALIVTLCTLLVAA